MDHAGRILGGKGEFAIITASLTAANRSNGRSTSRPAARRSIPKIKMAVAAALRRPAEEGVRRDEHDSQRASEREADHGDLLARRAGRGRGGQAIAAATT